jgi:catalase
VRAPWDVLLPSRFFPVFFIQDGIKFPDIVHAAKPHPDREIPQVPSAHDTFWDFVSLHLQEALAQHRGVGSGAHLRLSCRSA